MNKEKPIVVITRTQPDAGVLAQRLDSMGYEAFIEPMLAVRATHAATTHDPLCVEGLVVTSAQALRHLNTLVREVALRHKPLYAVGLKTASVARELGWTHVHDGGGDVRALGSFLKGRKEITPSSRLLHICGRDIAKDTRGVLDSVPGTIWDWVVYETDPVSGFSTAFKDVLGAGRVKAVLCHSPRAAAVFGQCVQTYEQPLGMKGIIFLCLSSSVLESLPSFDYGGAYAANTPDEDALLDLLKVRVPT